MKKIKLHILLLLLFALSDLLAQTDSSAFDSTIIDRFDTASEVVISGTKTFKRKTESALIVNVLDKITLQNVQACNLSEGLKFMPGLRVETDCQTCNYTQLRMNGLQGGYSQLLINGRPIFSPLMGLYGMEQIPVSMIDKIEVLKGAGSSLYGSNAIGGTVNIITKIPEKNFYELNAFFQSINLKTADFNLSANGSIVNKNSTAGLSFFFNRRDRNFYDANADNFSEIPQINSTALGFNTFFKPFDNHKLELSLNYINEYRLGGEMLKKPVYLLEQAEERLHNIWTGSLDYRFDFNQSRTAIVFYTAFQNTGRSHYTGIIPDDANSLQLHLKRPPYGATANLTWQSGLQFNHKLDNFLNGKNLISLGVEYLADKVVDSIPSYNYLIDQNSKNLGLFAQSDWDIIKKLNVLVGLRMDKHNFVDHVQLNPRIAFLYKIKRNLQFRISYGTGFRAPQAFDTDMHLAFASGGISRIRLSENLKPERSQSVSGSVNYDKISENWILGFTLEAFYTDLKNAFALENIGIDSIGEVFEKRNKNNAAVRGLTLELRLSWLNKLKLETGFTLQNSEFSELIAYSDNTAPLKQFLRTPNDYGFANLDIMPFENLKININYVYTGSMKLLHFKSDGITSNDEISISKPFSELNLKISYSFQLKKLNNLLDCYIGLKNILDDFQKDFDSGKNRDSNYIYGPNLPRTFFIGFNLKMN